jgi:hypothetical protein
MALTTSSSVALAKTGCTECPVAPFTCGRQARKCFYHYPRMVSGPPRITPTIYAIAHVLVVPTGDRGLASVDRVIWSLPHTPNAPYRGLSGSLQPGKSIHDHSQFFPGSSVFVTWPKRVRFIQDKMIHPGIRSHAGVGNV